MRTTVAVERVVAVVDALGEQRQAHATAADLARTQGQPGRCMTGGDRLEQSRDEGGEAYQEGLLAWIHRQCHRCFHASVRRRVPAAHPAPLLARLLPASPLARLLNGSSAPIR